MFVVAGVTGKVGAAAARALLERGRAVRVIVRDQAKGEPWRELGAEVVVGSLADWELLTGALRGAEGALLLLPRSTRGELYRHQCAIADAEAAAVAAAHVGHVVFISSQGGHRADAASPLRGFHYAEQRLWTSGATVTILRAAYFMENWVAVGQPTLAQGTLPNFLDEERAIPMVSARDVGESAALCLEQPPARSQVIELGGPREYRPADVAQVLGRLLARPVRLLTLAPDAPDESGAQPHLAAEIADYYAGLNAGRVAWQGGAAQPRRGLVPLDEALAAAVSPTSR